MKQKKKEEQLAHTQPFRYALQQDNLQINNLLRRTGKPNRLIKMIQEKRI